MGYRVDIKWADDTETHTEYSEYSRAKSHADYRLEEPDCVAVRVTNELNGKVRFKRAKDAQGLRWLGPALV